MRSPNSGASDWFSAVRMAGWHFPPRPNSSKPVFPGRPAHWAKARAVAAATPPNPRFPPAPPIRKARLKREGQPLVDALTRHESALFIAFERPRAELERNPPD